MVFKAFKTYLLGLDVGSTTVKVVVLDSNFEIKYSKYERHYSDIKSCILNILRETYFHFKNQHFKVMITGSGGLSVSKWLEVKFIQEVAACTKAVEYLIPETEVAIELGGEDAKITFFKGSLDQRMNGTCAGGTGSFIDQMSALLNTNAEGLNKLAENYKMIYPIASRCGVFAKTDIQALLNEGIRKEDIAASIFQSVVNQTISGLSGGKRIGGRVAFLGGPLYFLPELKKRFVETLNLEEEHVISPDSAQFFVAVGAAISAEGEMPVALNSIIERLIKSNNNDREVERLNPLFKDKEDYLRFKKRHDINKVIRKRLEEYEGPLFLGIDAGSTTTKAVLIDRERNMLYSFYKNNLGKPLELTIEILKDIYHKINSKSYIAKACVTGYGEELIKSALSIDMGEVETIAHYKAAEHFLPGVEFILDIGGQDMKCMRAKDGNLYSILLNEACSSGCGSFIETFAGSVNMSVQEFTREGLYSSEPVDLGSRCTVFMNSRVKQAQKEGAKLGDISAGLAYSVIKNALNKVIKIRNNDEIGDKIILQGGTFLNDTVLRSFELLSGKEVVRPDIAGLMGAFGSAIIALNSFRDGEVSNIISLDELEKFKTTTTITRCGKCTNNCLLTIKKFPDGRRFFTGNRCERGEGIKSREKAPNLYKYKYERIFSYKPLDESEANRGVIGIPRTLNIYENYPLWFTFLKELGFRVILSSESSRKIYEKGMETIPSESVCYPGKIAHGHIVDLLNKGVKTIFYPSVFYERCEDPEAQNNLNCPIVCGYPEVIKHNIPDINGIKFISPFITLNDKNALEKELYKAFKGYKIKKSEIWRALNKGFEELEAVREDIRNKGREVLEELDKNNGMGIVLCGRPYHIDPEINHGIPELITSFNIAVLTEDSVDFLGKVERPLRVIDQWTYHSRLYNAAEFVSKKDNLQVIQLNSFGCGLDAVTTDQVQEILNSRGKIYTCLKIDEISNLGAVKIRLRSLLAAVKEKKGNTENTKYTRDRIEFTEEMRKSHKILAPQMSPIHFQFLEKAFSASGYDVEILQTKDKKAIDEGLKYVNNDACFPAILTVGQFMEALKSEKYDLNNTSLLITQTGGVCRASNYIAFLRKALSDAGFENIPVISLNPFGIENNSGFKFSYILIKRMVMALLYGDLLMMMLYRVRPYETVTGSSMILYDKWVRMCKDSLNEADTDRFVKIVNRMVVEFDKLEIRDIKKPIVGIVGEILVKFHPTANNNVVEFIESEGAEAVVPDLTGFILYCAYNEIYKHKHFGREFKNAIGGFIGIKYIEYYRNIIRNALRGSRRFPIPTSIEKLAKLSDKLISRGNQSGEGWLLTAEMLELIEHGVENIICMQPFACLPNHITGKGIIKSLKELNPRINIAAIDYDPGISEVNQLNRIKLMMSSAFKNLDEAKPIIKRNRKKII